MARKLASVQIIHEVSDIAGADKIQQASVLGWHVVIGKGEFKDGDMVVYCEIDSILPKEYPPFASFEGKPLKTKKIRGILSQGVCFPIDILPAKLQDEVTVGSDVTEILNIKKYEPDVNNRKGSTKYPYPTFINKTDETRVQSIESYLHKYKGTPCIATEKLDGSSITFWRDFKNGTGELHVCTRNREIVDHQDKFYKTAEKYFRMLEILPMNYVFQGELIGSKIQGNRYGFDNGQWEIYIFNISVVTPEGTFPLEYSEMEVVCQSVGLKQVPLAYKPFELPDDVDQIVEMAKGQSKVNPKWIREGIVIRPVTNILGMHDSLFAGDWFHFKAINPDYLLKWD